MSTQTSLFGEVKKGKRRIPVGIQRVYFVMFVGSDCAGVVLPRLKDSQGVRTIAGSTLEFFANDFEQLFTVRRESDAALIVVYYVGTKNPRSFGRPPTFVMRPDRRLREQMCVASFGEDQLVPVCADFAMLPYGRTLQSRIPVLQEGLLQFERSLGLVRLVGTGGTDKCKVELHVLAQVNVPRGVRVFETFLMVDLKALQNLVVYPKPELVWSTSAAQEPLFARERPPLNPVE